MCRCLAISISHYPYHIEQIQNCNLTSELFCLFIIQINRCEANVWRSLDSVSSISYAIWLPKPHKYFKLNFAKIVQKYIILKPQYFTIYRYIELRWLHVGTKQVLISTESWIHPVLKGDSISSECRMGMPSSAFMSCSAEPDWSDVIWLTQGVESPRWIFILQPVDRNHQKSRQSNFFHRMNPEMSISLSMPFLPPSCAVREEKMNLPH